MVRVRDVARAAARSPLASSVRTHFTLARYLATGGLVGLIDLGTLSLMLRAHSTIIVGTTVAYLVSVVFHFTINKLFTFRNLERTNVDRQIRAYAVVSIVCYLSTIAIVEGLAHAGVDPRIGKVVGILVNVPLGFFCNRRFTFAARP